MTDGLNSVWSSDRASVTDTRLDQLVYSPNCYIQIFQTQPFNHSEDRTPTHSLEIKVQRAYRLRYWAIYYISTTKLLRRRPDQTQLILILEIQALLPSTHALYVPATSLVDE